MTLTAGDARDDGIASTAPLARRPGHRGRSLFSTPETLASAPAPTRDAAQSADQDADGDEDQDEDQDDQGHQWADGDVLGAARARFVARRAYASRELTLPHIDSDGHVVLPPELVAKQGAEADAAEAERIANLTPARLDAVQMRRWTEWLAEYQLHRPTYLRLDVGPRGEMLARNRWVPYVWEDADERHPDGGRVIVRWPRPEPVGDPSAERASLNGPRAFPNERVLDAIRQQFLMAWWLPAESNKPLPPTPLTINERIDAMVREREARAAAKRQPNYNWKLIIEGGRGW